MTAHRLPNLRPRPTAYDDDGVSDDSGSQDGSANNDHETKDAEVPTDEEGSHRDEGERTGTSMASVSFGTLKQAQDSLSKKRKRGSEDAAGQEGKLEALRKRLQQIKEEKSAAGGAPMRSTTTKAQTADDSGAEDDSEDSGSGPSEEDAPGKSRSSKHAPAAQSSKRQVTRKRTVIDVPKRVVRDPRFDAFSQSSAHPGNSEKAYGFLRDYQKSEIEELKAAMKKTKDEDDMEVLKRKIGSMQNRLKAKESKEREQDIIRQHRKDERDRVEQGKTPYYLKQKDIKEKALVEKFKGMKSKEREKAVEKRRRKEGQKEKKRMPEARRMAG